MTPATSVSVVDSTQRKFVGEIELAGCTEVIVTRARRFVSLCADGSLMTTSFDDLAKITHRERSKPFFDSENDPVFAAPAIIAEQACCVGDHAIVHPVDLSTDEATPGVPWPLLSQEETAAHWKPGGLQVLGVNLEADCSTS